MQNRHLSIHTPGIYVPSRPPPQAERKHAPAGEPLSEKAQEETVTLTGSASPGGRGAGETDEIPLTILHTNDLHGHARPMDGGKVGGLAHLATVIHHERAKDPPRTLLMDAGDSVEGSPLSDFFDGQPMVESMNAMKYDAAVLGNHDFDTGVAGLAERLSKTKTPVLAANLQIFDRQSGLYGKTTPYMVRTIDGHKVAIIGLVTPDAHSMLRHKEDRDRLAITSPEEAVNNLLPGLQAKGIKTFIVLSHLGIDGDRALAGKCPGISLIVGGHSHSELQKPEQVGSTLIVQAGCNGAMLGETELLLDRKTGKATLADYRLIPVNSAMIPPDTVVEDIVAKYDNLLGPVLNEWVTTLGADLTQRDYHRFREESNLGNAMADLMREQAHADIGFLTAGSFRCNLSRGEVTKGDIYTMLPWKDQLTTISLRGKHIPELLEQGLTSIANGVAISGLKVVIDSSRPEGSQVISVKTERGEPLDPEKYYTIATKGYIAEGASGFEIMQQGKERKDLGDLRENVISCMKKTPYFNTVIDGRLTNLSS